MTQPERIERRKIRCHISIPLRRYLRWWPIFIFIYYSLVAYFPPANFRNHFSVNLYAGMAWAVAICAFLSLIFPFRLNIKSLMCSFAIARWLGAIASTLYEHEDLKIQGTFWSRFFLLNAALALTLLWVGLYAVTIPYMKELDHERHR